MKPSMIGCGTCGRSWEAAGPLSVYESQTLEAAPCPHCGAYTLLVPQPGEAPRGRQWVAKRLRWLKRTAGVARVLA